jgi:glycosyltransferase involved in cell wall biosynthesis
MSRARERVDFQAVLFGAHEPREDVPPDAEFYFNPSQPKLLDLYRSSDIFLSPSWLESGPMPPMEAMACGCAVVASDSKGILEYAIDGENTILSEPKHPDQLADSVIRVLTDRQLMLRLSENGRRRMTEFTYDSTVAALIGILEGKQLLDETN